MHSNPGCRERRFVIAALAALFVHPLSGTAQGSATESAASGAFPSNSAVLEILKERVARGRTAGLVVGLLDAGGHTRFVSWGQQGSPVIDNQSVFEIGSVTKVFTATLLADMVLKGEVSLDDPVQDYLPPGVTVPTRSGKPITLGLLAEQRSGLPRLPDNIKPADLSNPYADYSVQQLYDFLSSYNLTRDPGAAFEYSNLGVGLLGHALALRAGVPYEVLIRRRVLEPLGMTHTGVTLSPWMEGHLIAGHDERGDEVPLWDLPTLAGAGALRSTAADLLLFLAANLETDRGPLGAAMDLAQTERAQTSTPTWLSGSTG